MPNDLATEYESRIPLLVAAMGNIENELAEALKDVPHIDRVTFRLKGTKSFVEKATNPANEPSYIEPLVEVEDQIAGRVIVFFLDDIEVVAQRIEAAFDTIEHSIRRPLRDEEFGYESEHRICMIRAHHRPAGWDDREDLPTTFELQVRTIFMHAYAEPQHDFAYKRKEDLPRRTVRELAWVAASAWGADQAYVRVLRDGFSGTT